CESPAMCMTNHFRQPMLTALLLCAAVVSGLTPRGVAGEEAAAAGFSEVIPRQEEAIEKALAWLAKNQGRDGSWSSEGSGGTYQMAMTGLAGLAFLSAGH